MSLNLWGSYKAAGTAPRLGAAAVLGFAIVLCVARGVELVSPVRALEKSVLARPPTIVVIQYAAPSGDCSQSGPNYGSINNNCHNTYNMTPPERHMNEALAQQILTKISKDKPISVFCTMGQDEGCQFAQEIYDFFKQNGYTMKDTGPGQAVYNKPLKGMAFDPSTGDFRVGSQ